MIHRGLGIVRTGVSNAMQAMMLGQMGDVVSALDLQKASKVSAASKPPML